VKWVCVLTCPPVTEVIVVRAASESSSELRSTYKYSAFEVQLSSHATPSIPDSRTRLATRYFSRLAAQGHSIEMRIRKRPRQAGGTLRTIREKIGAKLLVFKLR
jgi:hypothetical protein